MKPTVEEIMARTLSDVARRDEATLIMLQEAQDAWDNETVSEPYIRFMGRVLQYIKLPERFKAGDEVICKELTQPHYGETGVIVGEQTFMNEKGEETYVVRQSDNSLQFFPVNWCEEAETNEQQTNWVDPATIRFGPTDIAEMLLSMKYTEHPVP